MLVLFGVLALACAGLRIPLILRFRREWGARTPNNRVSAAIAIELLWTAYGGLVGLGVIAGRLPAVWVFGILLVAWTASALYFLWAFRWCDRHLPDRRRATVDDTRSPP